MDARVRPAHDPVVGATKRAPVETGAPYCNDSSRPLLLGAALERGAEKAPQRRARIGRAVLRDGFLLFGDFQRLDRDLHLAGLLVELDDASINLFANSKTLSALIAAIAGEFR